MSTQPVTPEPISARFGGVPLPRGFREAAQFISWSTLTSTYGPTTGPLRLGQWHCGDAGRPASRLGPEPRKFEATFAIGDRIETATAAATGPVAALTAMLYDRGIAVEMLRFHQLQSDGHTITFVQGSDGRRAEWAMGWSEDSTQSALRAVIACANRLMTADLAPNPAIGHPAPTACRAQTLGQPPPDPDPSPQRSERSRIGIPSIGTGMPPWS